MRTNIALGALTLSLLTFLFAPAGAHSLRELQTSLGEREKYFQPIDKEAPGFTLQDADGHNVSLTDFRGKVVVLHFIYTNCPDVCPLHTNRIAELQALINQSQMKQ